MVKDKIYLKHIDDAINLIFKFTSGMEKSFY